MDCDNLDATQAIYDEFDDETDEDSSASQGKPVAYLVVQEQKGLQNKEYPVYEGDNLIGRQESCQICIPSKSLSKEHACITVKSGSHLIYDKGSRNKTKRGKLFLSPDVRYELKHQNELLFADVSCMYVMALKKEMGRDSGSETEEDKVDASEKTESSPSMDKNANKQPGAVLCAQSDEEDYASDASSDILQPTQPCDATTSNTGGLQNMGTSNEVGRSMESNLSSVMETPEFLKKQLDDGATLVLPESGSETDDESVTAVPPETLVFHDNDDNTESESGILGAATQAIDDRGVLVDEIQEYGSDNDDRMSEPDVDMEAATQAMCHGPSPKNKGKTAERPSPKPGIRKRKNTAGSTKKNVEVEKTQAYEIDIDSDNSSSHTKNKTSKRKIKNVALTTMETQKMEDVESVDSDEGSETGKAHSLKKMKIMTMETQKIEDEADDDSEGTNIKNFTSAEELKIAEMETQKMEDVTDDEDEEVTDKYSKGEKVKDITEMETQKMDTEAEDSAEENEDPHLSGLFSTSTLACEISDEESDDNGKSTEANVNFDDATQAIGDTVAFEDEEEEPVPKRGRASKRTAVTWDGDSTVPVEDSTIPVGSKAGVDGKTEGATVPVDVNDATMPVDASDATMPVNANDAIMPINASDATVTINAGGATMPIDSSDATMPIDSRPDAPTVAVEETEDLTTPLDDKTEDATMPLGEKSDDATAPIELTAADATMPIDNEAATVPISNTVSASDAVPISDTVAVSDTLAVSDTVPISETVPVSDIAAIESTTVRGRKTRKSPTNTADTLPVTDMINDGTQEFGESGVCQDDVATLPLSDKTSGEDDAISGDTVPLADDESLPMLLPQITRGSDASDDESTQEMVPESQNDEESTSLIRLPERSPFKSALVDPATRSKSPSPKRVAFTEPEESDDESPQPASRGKKRGPQFKPETSCPPQRKGRGCGTKITGTNRGNTSQDNTSSSKGAAYSKSDDDVEETETSKDFAEVVPLSLHQKADTVKPAASKGRQTSMSEPRRSGRARRAKKFADGNEEGEIESKAQKEETADTPAQTQASKRTHGKANNRGGDSDPESKQIGKDLLDEEESAEKEPGSSVAVSDSATEVKPGLSESKATKTGRAIVDEASTLMKDKDGIHEAHIQDNPDVEEEEPMEAEEHERKTENTNVTKRKTTRAGRTTKYAPKRAGNTDTDEQVAKKAKRSPGADVDQPEYKVEDKMEIGREENTSRNEEYSEETQTKSRRVSRKGSKLVEDDKAQEVEVESTSGQKNSKSRGRTSVQIDNSAVAESTGRSSGQRETNKRETEDKSESVTVSKGRRASRGAKRLAESSEEAVTESDHSQDMSASSKNSGKNITEEELMDTEDTRDDTQDNTGLTGRRGRAQATKRSEKDRSETVKEMTTKGTAPKNQPKSRRSQISAVEDSNTQKSSDKVTEDSNNETRRSRTARGKLDVVKEPDTASTSQTPNKSHQEPGVAIDSSTPAASKKRTNKQQTEKIMDKSEESSQESPMRRRGRQGHKSQSYVTREVAEKTSEEETPSSTNRKGCAKQSVHETETDKSVEKEESAESSAKPARKTRTARSAEKNTAVDPQTLENGDDSGYLEIKQGQQTKKTPGMESGEPAEASTKARRQTRKSLRPEKDVSEDSQSEHGSQCSVTRRGRQSKQGNEKDTSSVETTEEKSLDPALTRRSRQPTKSQSDSKAEQNGQNPTPTRASRQSKRTQDKDNDKVSEHKQETTPEDTTPARRGRQAKKMQSAERDISLDRQSKSSTQSHSQEPVASYTGRKGQKSQNTSSEGSKQDTGKMTDRASISRGGKRTAAQRDPSGSDVADSETVEHSEGPTPQKRGRKGKDPGREAEVKNKSLPTPTRLGRHMARSGSETPKHSGQKVEAESLHSPSLRRSSVAAKPKIMFTGVIDEHGQKIVKELGGELAQSVQECTHLVTDKIRRTVKFLGGVARGVMIVTPQWLESSKSSGMFVDGSRFIVQDIGTEKQHKFSLKSSLHKAAQAPMLEGYRIHVTKSVQPEPQQMKEILQCAGAEWLASMPKKAAKKTVVVSCDEDKNACQTALNAGIDVVSAEFVLTGILRQEASIDELFSSTQGTSSSRSRR